MNKPLSLIRIFIVQCASLMITNRTAMNNHFCVYREWKAPRTLFHARQTLGENIADILCQQWMNFKWDYSCCMGFDICCGFLSLFLFLSKISSDKNKMDQNSSSAERKFIGMLIESGNFQLILRCIIKSFPKQAQNFIYFLMLTTCIRNVI